MTRKQWLPAPKAHPQPLRASGAPIPYEHHWRSPDEQLSASRQFLATMARATLLGRPSNERPYLLIPVGYPTEGATVPAITKKPLEEVLVHLAAREIAPSHDGLAP